MRIIELRESGEIYDKQNFNPEDPEVLIHGYGRLKLSQIYQKLSKDLADLSEKAADHSDPKTIEWALDNSSFRTLLKAAQDVEKELASPSMKRKITMMRKTS